MKNPNGMKAGLIFLISFCFITMVLTSAGRSFAGSSVKVVNDSKYTIDYLWVGTPTGCSDHDTRNIKPGGSWSVEMGDMINACYAQRVSAVFYDKRPNRVELNSRQSFVPAGFQQGDCQVYMKPSTPDAKYDTVCLQCRWTWEANEECHDFRRPPPHH